MGHRGSDTLSMRQQRQEQGKASTNQIHAIIAQAPRGRGDESRRDKEGREGEVGELLIRIEQRESKREARLGS
jgi:hypothetical protein